MVNERDGTGSDGHGRHTLPEETNIKQKMMLRSTLVQIATLPVNTLKPDPFRVRCEQDFNRVCGFRQLTARGHMPEELLHFLTGDFQVFVEMSTGS